MPILTSDSIGFIFGWPSFAAIVIVPTFFMVQCSVKENEAQLAKFVAASSAGLHQEMVVNPYNHNSSEIIWVKDGPKVQDAREADKDPKKEEAKNESKRP